MFEILVIAGIAGIAYILSKTTAGTPAGIGATAANPLAATAPAPTSTVQKSNNLTAIEGTLATGIATATVAALGIGAGAGAATGGAVGAASAAAGIGAGAAGTGGGAVAAGGATAAAGGITAGAALATAGIAAAAALAAIAIGNFIRCGTITSLGCTKTLDANATEEAIAQARMVYQAFLNGQISQATALAAIAQIATEVKTYLKRSTDYTQAAPGPEYACGNFTSYSAVAQSNMGHPANLDPSSPAYQAFCNLPRFSLQFMLEQGFPNLINGNAQASYFNGGTLASAITANAPKGI